MRSRVVVLTACLGALALSALAPAQFFAQRSNEIRAAVAIIQSNQSGGVPENETPFAWYNLERNLRIKPAAFKFVNPSHSTQFTAADTARWNILMGGGAPPAGTLVKKEHAPYWELMLDTASEAQMSSFDVILLASYGVTRLAPAERDKLRRFVERGGVLWIDTDSVTSIDPVNGYPMPFTQTNASLGTTPGIDYSQPLVAYPEDVTSLDLTFMQSDTVASFTYLNLTTLGLASHQPIFGPLESESLRLSTVAADGRGPFVVVGQLGDGFVVATTRGVAATLNRIPVTGGYNANDAATALPFVSDRTGDAAAKLAVNMVSLLSANAQANGGARRTGSTAIDFGAPQLQRFVDPQANTPISTNSYRPPALFKGALVMSVSDHLVVYDANPKQDLDGNGDPDDGVQDFGLGSSFDVIWESAPLAGGTVSAPTCFEIANPTDPTMRDQIAVQDGTGRVYLFPLFSYNPDGSFAGSTSVSATYIVSPASGGADFTFTGQDAAPYAPTFHEGFLFVTDVQTTGLSLNGRLWIVNPATGREVTTGANAWAIGGSAIRIFGEPGCPSTVGYIPIADGSGGLDRVVYVGTRPDPSITDPSGNATISSVWFGVKGERPTSHNQTPTYLEVQTRASGQSLSILRPAAINDEQGLGVKLTILHSTGVPYTPTEMTTVFDGTYTESNGILRFGFNAGQSIGVNDGVRVDYTIDYGTGVPTNAQNMIRGSINLPDDPAKQRRILNNIGLTPQGTIHVVTSGHVPWTGPLTSGIVAGYKAGGTYLAIKEEGRGNFKVLNRFDLYRDHTITLNQAQALDVSYPETLKNSDPVRGFVPFPAQPLRAQTFVGGPVIRDGVAYVTAAVRESFFGFSIPHTAVMAFRAEPTPIAVRVGALSNGFTILQPDLTRSTNISAVGAAPRPDTYNILQPSQYVYEEVPGADLGTIRLDSLSSNTRGAITNCLSTSQPIIIRQNGREDRMIEPDASGSRWNQMLWYSVALGVHSNTPAFVSGKTLFGSGASSWPELLAGNNPITEAGVAIGMDTQISPTDSYLQPGDPNRPWFKQVHMVKTVPTFDVNPAYLWPSVKGVTSWNDYRIRLEQSVLRLPNGFVGNISQGITGGDGTIVAWADNATWAFSKADFLVADEGRVIRVDAKGAPIWAMTTTYRSALQGDAGATSQPNQLVRPTRAYPLGDREVLIVDTGANRVLRTDVSGRESRVIGGFSLDPIYRPAGMAANESLKLNAPRDVLTYNTLVAAASNPLSNAQPTEYWRHYLIADSGNKRLVEVVDRYAYNLATRQIGDVVLDANGARGIGVLYWHSPVSQSGGRFDYTSLARIYSGGRWVTAAGIGNRLPTKLEVGLDTPITDTSRPSEGGNGGIVIFDGANTIVINQIDIPAIGANVYWDTTSGSYNSPAIAPRSKLLGGLNSVSMRNVLTGGGSQIAIMLTDSDGVYEVLPLEVTPGRWVGQVQWMLDRESYRTIRRTSGNLPIPSDNPSGFKPSYAKRLESGDVLICNAYSGYYDRALVTDPRVACSGEVILLDGGFDPTAIAQFGFNFAKINFGFSTMSVKAVLNNKPGSNPETRGIVLPMFADKQ